MKISLEEEDRKRFKDWDVQKVQLIETSKNAFRSLKRGGGVMERIDAVVKCTPICVKIKSKLTNLMIKSRIEGYNGK